MPENEAPKSFNADWEREAHNWIAWARTSHHDSYLDYAPTFLETVPPPGRATLEIGCGEGRVSRDLVTRGHRMTGIDASPTLLEAARAADPRSEYLLADVADLPFEAGRFDLAVAYNSLMDVGDMPGAVGEAARVLAGDGRLCFCVTHPMADAGRFQSREPDAPFVITGSYLARRRFEETFERGGLRMTFHGWRYPLEAYTRALEEAGLVIEHLREPAPIASAVAHDPGERRRCRLPLFLFVRARKA